MLKNMTWVLKCAKLCKAARVVFRLSKEYTPHNNNNNNKNNNNSGNDHGDDK
jgi:hypothetical protein